MVWRDATTNPKWLTWEEVEGMSDVEDFASKMPPGTSLSPKGDLGTRRQRESVLAGGFATGETLQSPFKELS